MALFLTRRDVEACLTMDDTLQAVERAFKEHGEGTTNMPVRSGIRLEKAKGTILFMPAYMEI